MTPADWSRLNAVLDGALDLAPEAQVAFLDAQDLTPVLRARAEAMLAADEAEASILDDPGRMGSLMEAAEADAESVPTGTEIGPYRVVREIGRGGMGTVVLAERADGAFEKRVALKLVRPGVAPGLLARFRAERRILARLEHPGIARLLDGGRTDDGRPYLAMEYVDGEPITDYADRQRLTIEQRLALFEQVCDAVAYAHRNLVVHRDLKPSNILVASGEAREGGSGQPSVAEGGSDARSPVPTGHSPLAPRAPRVKLLDFGIAKLLDDSAEHSIVETAPEQRLLTPAYAAPEQVRGEPPSTATDVYALGVLLYELLTGRRPYRLHEKSRRAVERAILEDEPTRPSTAITDASGKDDAAPEAITASRATEVRRLRKRLAGDLDQIVLAALRKEPERRYTGAAALGADVRRHLEGLPVEARPDSAGYRIGRFVRRHRMGVAMTALALVVSALYVVTLRAERDLVASERDRAEASFAYVQSLFAATDPSRRPRADTLLARHVLDAGVARLADIEDPRVAAGLGRALGRAYYELALYRDAVAVLERADSLYARTNADTSRAAVIDLLGRAEQNLNRNEAAEGHFRRAHALHARALGQTHPLTLLSYVDLCNGLRYRTEPVALNACRDSLHAAAMPLVQNGDPPSAERYQLFYRIAELSFNVRDIKSAEEWSTARANNTGPWSDTPVAEGWAASQDASLAIAMGHPQDGVIAYRKAHDVWRSVYGPDHPLVLYARNNVAAALLQAGESDRALPILQESVARFDALGPAESVANAFIAQGLLARALSLTGQTREAESIYRRFLPSMTKAWGPNNPFRLAYVLDYGRSLAAADRAPEAVPLLEEATERFGVHHPEHYLHGEALVALSTLRDGPAAEALAQRGLRVLTAALPEGHWRIEQAREVARQVR